MRLDEAKAVMIADCGDRPDLREAIEALPDRALFDRLDPLLRSLAETRLHQLVTLEVVP